MTHEKQKTAVDWLQSIEMERGLTLADWGKAKELEKQQIKDAWCNWRNIELKEKNEEKAEQYFNETFE